VASAQSISVSPPVVCPAAGNPGRAVAAIVNHLRAIGVDKDDQVIASRKKPQTWRNRKNGT